jgi:pSer/pThr/pTyr-binding forkhead associated (FHA) protein
VSAAQPSPSSAPTVPPGGGISSTVIAWPGGTPQVQPDNGSAARDAEAEAATSIMPAWQPPQAAAAKETLALHSLNADQVTQEAPAKLTFETGPFAGRVVGVPQQSAMIGRAPSNDIIIGDPATSGRHCRIELRQGEYWISDLGSTNGTLVNGEPIIDKQLAHGDVISIGQNTIRFTLQS